MRASHKKLLARLITVLDAAEDEAVDRRCDLRLEECMCKDIRAAMERRGIDPASAWALRNAEANVAAFRDSPELQAADEAYLAAHREEEPPEEQDPFESLADELYQIGERYLDGSQPDFRFGELMDLWAWALVQYRLLPAIPDGGYGWSETSQLRGIVE